MQTFAIACQPRTPIPVSTGAPCQRHMRPSHWPAATFIEQQLREIQRFERLLQQRERDDALSEVPA